MRRWFRRIADAFNRAEAPADVASGYDRPYSDANTSSIEPSVGAPDTNRPSGLLLRTELRLPRRLDVAFDRHLVGEGWHYCETDNHVPFRWMGMAQSATVWLALDRSVDLELELAILIIIDSAFWDQIRIAVGEPPEPVVYKRTANGLSFVLPSAPDLMTATKITLSARGRVPDSETDRRRLSIACSSMRVRPLDADIAEGDQLTLRTYLADHLSDSDATVHIAPAEGHHEIQSFG